jgi:hypothetical protein
MEAKMSTTEASIRAARGSAGVARVGMKLEAVGTNMTSATPGSAQGLYLIVSDIEAARDELVPHGAEVSEVFHAHTPSAQFQPDNWPERYATYMVAEQAGEELPT